MELKEETNYRYFEQLKDGIFLYKKIYGFISLFSIFTYPFSW